MAVTCLWGASNLAIAPLLSLLSDNSPFQGTGQLRWLKEDRQWHSTTHSPRRP